MKKLLLFSLLGFSLTVSGNAFPLDLKETNISEKANETLLIAGPGPRLDSIIGKKEDVAAIPNYVSKLYSLDLTGASTSSNPDVKVYHQINGPIKIKGKDGANIDHKIIKVVNTYGDLIFEGKVSDLNVKFESDHGGFSGIYLFTLGIFNINISSSETDFDLVFNKGRIVKAKYGILKTKRKTILGSEGFFLDVERTNILRLKPSIPNTNQEVEIFDVPSPEYFDGEPLEPTTFYCQGVCGSWCSEPELSGVIKYEYFIPSIDPNANTYGRINRIESNKYFELIYPSTPDGFGEVTYGANVIYNYERFVDVHITNDDPSNVQLFTSASTRIKIIDLKTGLDHLGWTTPTAFYSLPKGYYRILGETADIRIMTNYNYHSFTYYFYDDAGRMRILLPPNMVKPSINSLPEDFYTCTNQYNSLGRIISK